MLMLAAPLHKYRTPTQIADAKHSAIILCEDEHLSDALLKIYDYNYVRL